MTDLELGGNIRLAGFSEMDVSEMVVVKKIVGQYARRIRNNRTIQELSLTLKPVHRQGTNEKFEVHVRMKTDEDPKALGSEVTDKNLYIAIDAALKKVEAQAR